ncbi:hypothetical protein LIA77_02020 [Sarocladium implicatum]|nr:hypothetical protein LIA77_02020 [Sarocladium implicatum]
MLTEAVRPFRGPLPRQESQTTCCYTVMVIPGKADDAILAVLRRACAQLAVLAPASTFLRGYANAAATCSRIINEDSHCEATRAAFVPIGSVASVCGAATFVGCWKGGGLGGVRTIGHQHSVRWAGRQRF